MFIVIAIVCIRWLPASANRWHNLTVRFGSCGDPMQISLSMLKRAYELHFHVYCRLTRAKEGVEEEQEEEELVLVRGN